MAKLYTRVSEDYAKLANKQTEKLTEDLAAAMRAMDTVKTVLFKCSEFLYDNQESYDDERNNWFAEDDFCESRTMKEHLENLDEMISLAEKLNHSITRAKSRMNSLEFEYSENLAKWYAEEHKYDYERA